MAVTKPERLREAAGKATPGPWVAEGCHVFSDGIPIIFAQNDVSAAVSGIEDYAKYPTPRPARANADLISLCDPQTIIVLLDAVEALRHIEGRGKLEWNDGVVARRALAALDKQE